MKKSRTHISATISRIERLTSQMKELATGVVPSSLGKFTVPYESVALEPAVSSQITHSNDIPRLLSLSDENEGYRTFSVEATEVKVYISVKICTAFKVLMRSVHMVALRVRVSAELDVAVFHAAELRKVTSFDAFRLSAKTCMQSPFSRVVLV